MSNPVNRRYRTEVITNRPCDSYRGRSSNRMRGWTARAGPGPTEYHGR
jgi:hypothetical protein